MVALSLEIKQASDERRTSSPAALKIAEEVARLFFSENESTYSVYASCSNSRYDESHALGTLAVTLATQDFSFQKRENYVRKIQGWHKSYLSGSPKDLGNNVEFFSKKPPVTILLPVECTNKSRVHKSPKNNVSLVAADELHYDISGDLEDLVANISQALIDGQLTVTFLTPFDYMLQAAIALSHCIRKHGIANLPYRNSDDERDNKLPPSEQWERLRFLAGDEGPRNYTH